MTTFYIDWQVCDLFMKLFIYIMMLFLVDPWSHIIVMIHKTSTCIDWWSHFMDHRNRDTRSIMRTFMLENMMLDKPILRYYWDCYLWCAISCYLKWCTCRILNLRLPLIPRMCSGILWGCQMLFRNWVVIKVVFGFVIKHVVGYEQSRWNLPLFDNGRYISGPLEIVGLRKCLAMPIWLKS